MLLWMCCGATGFCSSSVRPDPDLLAKVDLEMDEVEESSFENGCSQAFG